MKVYDDWLASFSNSDYSVISDADPNSLKGGPCSWNL